MSCDAGFSLGFLCVRFYGIVLMLGALAGGYLATIEVKRRGHDPEIVWDLLVYLIIGGVLGARLWHILTPPPSSIAQGITTQYYLTHPLDALAIWRGGLGIPGTILGGLVALVPVRQASQGNRVPGVDGHRGSRSWLWDRRSGAGATSSIRRSTALRRTCRGRSSLIRRTGWPATRTRPTITRCLPTNRFSTWRTCCCLLWITRRYRGSLKQGDVFNVYCIFYPLVRFGLDFLRLDASQVLSVNINQTIMAVVAVGAVAVLIWRHRRRRKAALSAVHTSAAMASTSRPRSSRVPTKSAGAASTRTKGVLDVPPAARRKPAGGLERDPPSGK